MKDEMYDDDAIEEQEAADEQHTIAEIMSLVAKANHVPLEAKDPLMVLVTLCRILQKEARRDMRRVFRQYDAELRQSLTDISDFAHEREAELYEKSLKYLDGIGKDQAKEIVEKAESALTSALKRFLYKSLVPDIEKRFKKFYIAMGACLAVSVVLLLSSLVIVVFG